MGDGIVMSVCPREVKNAQIVAAQIADMLVNIDNVRVAFAMYEMADGMIGVSARSTGEFNVQLVMETLGGGGHRTVAGTQLKGMTIPEVQNALMDAVREVMDKETEKK
jgi:c-di-AMP phosphodiesterase-like protein